MKQVKILLVEDTDSVREVLTRQLEALGASVTALADGERVKSVLNADPTKPYDLVIADLQLPDCSGVDIARFAHAKRCKVVLLTGEGGLGTRFDIKSAGFDEVLSKPISLDELQQVLSRFGLLGGVSSVSATGQPHLIDETGVLDMVSLHEQMGELDGAALNMLSRFPDMMRPLFQRLVEAAINQNFLDVSDIAHSLKSAARSAGAMELGALCEKMQRDADRKNIFPSDITELQSQFASVEFALQRLCANSKT